MARIRRLVCGGKMKEGDLVKLRPKRAQSGMEEYVGVLLKMQQIGRNGSETILFDILVGELDEILTVSDIFFDVWRINELAEEVIRD